MSFLEARKRDAVAGCLARRARHTLQARNTLLALVLQRAESLSTSTTWPSRLWVVRHGESAGNLARLAAEAAGTETIEIEGRDVDVPLSELGERQSRAVGRWLKQQPENQRPSII